VLLIAVVQAPNMIHILLISGHIFDNLLPKIKSKMTYPA